LVSLFVNDVVIFRDEVDWVGKLFIITLLLTAKALSCWGLDRRRWSGKDALRPRHHLVTSSCAWPTLLA